MGIFQKKVANKPSTPGWDEFYQRFEDHFRGSAEEIKKRLRRRYEVDLRLLSASQRVKEPPVFLDLGCGRGDFLSLIKEWDFEPRGVDFNDKAVKICRDQQYRVVKSDILEFVRNQNSDSVAAVACMHVVEHVSFEYFWQVTSEVHRVLREGGVFIVETPSIYSLWAGVRQFYLDPTHVKPVHPETLRFLAQDIGFSSSEIKEFDPAVGPEIPAFEQVVSSDSPLHDEFVKMKKFLYGPMDMCVWSTK